MRCEREEDDREVVCYCYCCCNRCVLLEVGCGDLLVLLSQGASDWAVVV